jgi:hypothetical protein
MNENTLDYLLSLAETDIQREIIELISKMNTEGLNEEDIFRQLLSKMEAVDQ